MENLINHKLTLHVMEMQCNSVRQVFDGYPARVFGYPYGSFGKSAQQAQSNP